VIFYLGAPEPSWLAAAGVPLFVSRTRLDALHRKTFPKAKAPWALDSGGFKELEQHGRWTVEPKDYVREVRILAEKVGKLQWAAVQDWMVEPPIIYGGPTDPGSVAVGTGLSVEEHQLRTIESYCKLRELGGRDMAHLWAPVLQGWCVEDYVEHANLWETWGRVNLREVPVVGVGSVCRRQGTEMASALFRILTEQFGLDGRLHAFGSKTLGLQLEARAGKVAEPDLYATWGVEARAAGWPQVAIERAMAYATSSGPSTWEESDVQVCRLLQSSDSQAWSSEARHHANDVRSLRDELWGRDGWGQRGHSIYVGGRIVRSAAGRRSSYEGGREVGRVRPELAGEHDPLAPTQMLASCAESYARSESGQSHLACNFCLDFALAWRRALLNKLPAECRSADPPPRPKITHGPICGAANREGIKRAAAIASLMSGGHDRSWEALPGAEGPLLPLQVGFERMETPRRRAMPEPELCRAWGTGRLRWGEARIVEAGTPMDGPGPLPSPWQPWDTKTQKRLKAIVSEELRKARKPGRQTVVDMPLFDKALRDSMLPPLNTSLRDSLFGDEDENPLDREA